MDCNKILATNALTNRRTEISAKATITERIDTKKFISKCKTQFLEFY